MTTLQDLQYPMPAPHELLGAAFTDFRVSLANRFPDLLAELRTPAPFDVPYATRPGSEQLLELWRLTSGQECGKDGTLGIAGGLRLLGPVESEFERAGFSQVMTQGEGLDALANPSWDSSKTLDPAAVRPVYYAAGWIPVFSEAFEANYLAVDLVPLSAGRAGQIILCGRDEDDKCVVTADLATLFRALAAECGAGAWILKETATRTGKTVRFIERIAGRLLTSCRTRTFPAGSPRA